MMNTFTRSKDDSLGSFTTHGSLTVLRIRFAGFFQRSRRSRPLALPVMAGLGQVRRVHDYTAMSIGSLCGNNAHEGTCCEERKGQEAWFQNHHTLFIEILGFMIQECNCLKKTFGWLWRTTSSGLIVSVTAKVVHQNHARHVGSNLVITTPYITVDAPCLEKHVLTAGVGAVGVSCL
jgi:hypothetical protein